MRVELQSLYCYLSGGQGMSTKTMGEFLQTSYTVPYTVKDGTLNPEGGH